MYLHNALCIKKKFVQAKPRKNRYLTGLLSINNITKSLKTTVDDNKKSVNINHLPSE